VSESSADPGQSTIFDLVRRGYDRQQVDDHIRTLLTKNSELQQAHQPLANQLNELQQKHQSMVGQIAELQQAHQREHRRADWAEGELRSARTQLEQLNEQGNGGSQQGFGYRVEKLLRTAEQEAADVRSSAAREATSLLERARKDAEAHRHEVEQSLIHRTATLDQEAAQRKVELDERERQIGEQAGAARDETERMLSEVRRQADQLHHEAAARAEQERVKAEKSIRERQEAAEHELGRLRSLHDEVRGQLARLLESLANEFGVMPSGYQQAQAQIRAQNGQHLHNGQQHLTQVGQQHIQQTVAQAHVPPQSQQHIQSTQQTGPQPRHPRPYPQRPPVSHRITELEAGPPLEEVDPRPDAHTTN
jgi:cell division septum initiation protein DivIVA